MNFTGALFLENLCTNQSFRITAILTLFVVIVNGWTDAPNAIASCIATRSLKPKTAVLTAAVFNLLGALVMAKINTSVAETVLEVADFGGDCEKALVSLCAAMAAVVIWAVTAWIFGIPTSESHALTAGLAGASFAVNGVLRTNGLNKVLFGLVFSVALGFLLGFISTKSVEFICRNKNRNDVEPTFKKLQIIGASSMAFMHGAQDSQKFLSIFLLGFCLSQGQTECSVSEIPFYLTFLCAGIMSLGTSIGGYRIIKAVGMDMVNLTRYQGFSADIAGAVCLFVSSVFGLPVSTTQTKTSSLMGAGASRRPKSVNWAVALQMVYAWALTFPGCGFLGYVTSKIFLRLSS